MASMSWCETFAQEGRPPSTRSGSCFPWPIENLLLRRLGFQRQNAEHQEDDTQPQLGWFFHLYRNTLCFGILATNENKALTYRALSRLESSETSKILKDRTALGKKTNTVSPGAYFRCYQHQPIEPGVLANVPYSMSI